MRPSKGELRIEGIRRNKGVPSGATLLLEGREGTPIRPELRKPLEPYLQVLLREITDSSWELVLSLRPELLPPGELTGGARIFLTDTHNEQDLDIPVLWVRARPIRFRPDPLVVSGSPGRSFEVPVRMEPVPGVSIRAASVDHQDMRLEQRGDPTTWWLVGRIPEVGVIAAYLVVHLEDIDDPEASLRILVRAGIAPGPPRERRR